jgi:hypothetical protein
VQHSSAGTAGAIIDHLRPVSVKLANSRSLRKAKDGRMDSEAAGAWRAVKTVGLAPTIGPSSGAGGSLPIEA